MGAPTWPPTPEEAQKATLDEYGDYAKAVMDLESDEDAEAAILAHFLFEPPRRQLVAGEDVGLTLDSMFRALEGWLRMITGLSFNMAYSDPPSTDGEDLFLPRAVPAPLQPSEDALLYRGMGLIQLGFIHFGLLQNRRLITEMHTDWVLRSSFHLLAARYIIGRWSSQWPGIKKDFEAMRFLSKAGTMRVNLTEVPRRGMPKAFLPLYDGLCDFMEDAGPEGSVAQRAIEVVDALNDPNSDLMVIAGQAQRLREEFRRLRLGAPPLPYFIGILRPEWLLHDVAAEMAAANEWKLGNKPVRLLMETMKKKGRLTGALRRRMRPGGNEPPPMQQIVTTQDIAKPDEDGSREYDEWDVEKSCYRIAATRVIETDSNSGPLDHYNRIANANQGPIKEVRRKFAALRLEERWLHGQRDGSELDLNRAVSAMADIRAGITPKVDWYKRFQRQRQSVAILTLVDLSGSTQGNIIHLEQEALVLFAEGLKTLAFPHAFYGFSNRGPRNCRMQRIKSWDDQYDEPTLKRIGNLRPNGATRMGAFIRHSGWMLSTRPQGRRILIVLSDGRPEDQGEYRGKYGVHDTALAVGEARRHGVYIFCISMDTSEGAEDYLHKIFGPKNYLVLDRVDDLPTRLPEVFRALIR